MQSKEMTRSDEDHGSILLSEFICEDRTSQRHETLLGGYEVTLDTGQTFDKPGNNNDPLLILTSGQAAIIHDDNQQITTDPYPVFRGRVYGVVEALAGERYEYTMKAITKCTIFVVGREEFFGRIQRDPVMCFRLAQKLSRMNRELLLSVK